MASSIVDSAYKPFAKSNSTQDSQRACPQTLTINRMEGFRYFVVLHMGQQASSMVTKDWCCDTWFACPRKRQKYASQACQFSGFKVLKLACSEDKLRYKVCRIRVRSKTSETSETVTTRPAKTQKETSNASNLCIKSKQRPAGRKINSRLAHATFVFWRINKQKKWPFQAFQEGRPEAGENSQEGVCKCFYWYLEIYVRLLILEYQRLSTSTPLLSSSPGLHDQPIIKTPVQSYKYHQKIVFESGTILDKTSYQNISF